MPLMPPVLMELRANISEFTAKMGEAQQHVEKLAAAGESSGKRLREGVGAGLMGVGAAATGAGAVLLELGEKQEKAQQSLEVAIKNTGKSYDDYSKSIGEAVHGQEKFGHTADDTKTALAVLTRATGDTNKSLADMKLVTEIAAVHHSSLAEAAGLVAKMHAGSTKALKEFGINVKDAGQSTKDLAKAHDNVSSSAKKLQDAQEHLMEITDIQHGKAKLTEADHFALVKAKQDVANATYTHSAAESVLYTATKNSTGALDFNKESAMVLAKIHGEAAAQAGTFGGKLAALKARAEDMAGSLGQKLGPALTVAGPLLMGLGAIVESSVIPAILSATLAAAPWILAIAAVAGAAYLLYRNWDTVWGAIKTVVHDAVKFVTGHLDQILVAMGPIGWVIMALKDNWSKVWGAIHTAVADAWKIMQPIFGFIKRAIDDVAGPLGKVLGAVGKVGGIVGGALSHIPGFASGVDNFSGGAALVGENGPEILNLPRGSSVTPNSRLGGGNVTVHLTINGMIGNDRDVLEKIRNGLIQHFGKSNGTIFAQYA